MDKQDDEEYLNDLINDLQYCHNDNYNRYSVPEKSDDDESSIV